MARCDRRSWLATCLVVPFALAAARSSAAADSASLAGGRQIYEHACAACHGTKGTGAPRPLVAFDLPLPNFTDCNFSVREANTDWLAIIHYGGPARGFDRMMPAFHEALTPRQIDEVVEYLRGFCRDHAWPRGELNLPRAMFTEKAYPEDEAVLTTGIALEGAGSISGELSFEKRFGPLTQIEVAVPVQFENGTPVGPGWQLGLGDLAFAVKRVLLHSLRTGSIVSVSGELTVATGDARRGFGLGTPVFSPAVHVGQLWPALGFLQAQGGVELPFHGDRSEPELFARGVAGRTFMEARWGRAWSPMLEVLATRAIAPDARFQWDLVPQLQVTLSARHHVMASAAVRAPVDHPGTSTALYLYVLWDWFDGGLLEGW